MSIPATLFFLRSSKIFSYTIFLIDELKKHLRSIKPVIPYAVTAVFVQQRNEKLEVKMFAAKDTALKDRQLLPFISIAEGDSGAGVFRKSTKLLDASPLDQGVPEERNTILAVASGGAKLDDWLKDPDPEEPKMFVSKLTESSIAWIKAIEKKYNP